MLPDNAVELLRAARSMKLSYGVRLMRCPKRGHVVVVLGETHLKFAAAWELGEQLVAAFALRGVEGVPRSVLAGRLLKLLIHGPRQLLRILSLNTLRGSTIEAARAWQDGATVALEEQVPVPTAVHAASVHLCLFFSTMLLALAAQAISYVSGRPMWLLGALPLLVVELHFLVTILPAILLRRWRWAWVLCPVVGILGQRDDTMARGTIIMLDNHPDTQTALVIMGRAHLRGYCRRLSQDHGLQELDASGEGAKLA